MQEEYRKISRPEEGEYAPYAISYISLVPDERVLYHLQQNNNALNKLIAAQSEDRLNKGYAPGKWTLKELMVHVTDTERIFAYRALCIARGEQALLPGFDENAYAAASDAQNRSIENIMVEYNSVRQASIALLSGFSDEVFLNIGNANNIPVSVRALAYQIAGHEMHHMNIIKERYL
ncbi:MAG: DinB family protein [Bacteroidetes bacterium]|nr:DinB family protein [Bacteroidota bacterium]